MKSPEHASDPAKPVAARAELIELRFSELQQVFNSFDPSPFRERDLNVAAADYIVDWAKETPLERPLTLRVHLERSTGTQELEILSVAVREYFTSRSASTRRRLRELLRIGRISLMIGLIFLATCIFLSDLAGKAFSGWRFAKLLEESLLIGGWVAMWRPLEVFLYDWWPIRTEAQLYERLSRMPVDIVYQGALVPRP